MFKLGEAWIKVEDKAIVILSDKQLPRVSQKLHICKSSKKPGL